MTDPKPIHRLEETDDDRLRVITKDQRNLYDFRSANVLEREYIGLFTATVSKKGGPERLRVGSAAHIGDCEGWRLHGANGIYAEVPFRERELTESERAYCEEHMMYRDVESVVEFGIPHPEDLQAAIRDQDLDRFDCLDAVIEDAEQRHAVLTGLQERIEAERLRQNKLDPREGFPIDLDPEWDPSNDHNDDRDPDALEDMAGMRADAHQVDFRPIAGFDYWTFWYARARVLEFYEPELEPWDMHSLDVAGVPEWTYCRECGAVAPSEVFLHVDLERVDHDRRVCERCADRFAEWDHKVTYTEENVSRAKDDRAQRTGASEHSRGSTFRKR